MPENLVEATVRAIYETQGDRLGAQVAISRQFKTDWNTFAKLWALAIDRIERDQARGMAYFLGAVA